MDLEKLFSGFNQSFARCGIGSAILQACETEAKAHGFTSAEMMSTLSGVKLYSVRGYAGDECVPIPVGEGEKLFVSK